MRKLSSSHVGFFILFMFHLIDIHLTKKEQTKAQIYLRKWCVSKPQRQSKAWGEKKEEEEKEKEKGSPSYNEI